MTNETGTLTHLGNTAGDIRLDNPINGERGAVHYSARVHVTDFVEGYKPKEEDRVQFELQITSYGDRNAKQLRPI